MGSRQEKESHLERFVCPAPDPKILDDLRNEQELHHKPSNSIHYRQDARRSSIHCSQNLGQLDVAGSALSVTSRDAAWLGELFLECVGVSSCSPCSALTSAQLPPTDQELHRLSGPVPRTESA